MKYQPVLLAFLLSLCLVASQRIDNDEAPDAVDAFNNDAVVYWQQAQWDEYETCQASCASDCNTTCNSYIDTNLATLMAANDYCSDYSDGLTNEEFDDEDFFNNWDMCLWTLSSDVTDQESVSNHFMCVSDCVWNINISLQSWDEDWEDWDEDDYEDYYEEDQSWDDLYDCEMNCYDLSDCDDDCQMDMWMNFNYESENCLKFFTENFDEEGEYQGGDDVSVAFMDSYILCMDDNSQAYENASGDPDLYPCVKTCYSDLQSGLGYDEFEADEDLEEETKNKCDENTCYYEVFECMQKCEETICPNNTCFGADALDIDARAENEESCQNVVKHVELQFDGEGTEAYYEIAPLNFTGELEKCAEWFRAEYEKVENEYAVKFYECNAKCATDAMKDNAGQVIQVAFVLALSLLAVLL